METETLIQAEVASDGRQRERGIFEKVPGSDEWWIRYHDAESRLRREKAGTHGMAVKLYQKRKMEALRGKKLPETLRKLEMPTLRRLLRVAHEWRVINRVPRIRLLRGERNREFVLSHAQERLYLEMAPEPLKDAAMLMLDTGLRVGEILSLEWSDVHLEPVGNARFGFIHIPKGKSKNAKRNLSLTPRVRAMLESRHASRKSVWVFADEPETGPLPIWTLDGQHKRMKAALRLPADAVIHSFRHTFGTRLGEAGADAFTIMRAMGHSSVVVSQKYVHPTPEAMERAFERLNAANEKALASLPGSPKPALTATVSATVAEGGLEPIRQVV